MPALETTYSFAMRKHATRQFVNLVRNSIEATAETTHEWMPIYINAACDKPIINMFVTSLTLFQAAQNVYFYTKYITDLRFASSSGTKCGFPAPFHLRRKQQWRVMTRLGIGTRMVLDREGSP
jgi:hypothetical protein